MSSVDIDEMYEKLLQIYKVRYDYANPRMMLYYRVSELVREEKNREKAIRTLYEGERELTSEEGKKLQEAIRRKKREETEKKAEETIRRQIEDYERSIERLTTLFSKGEIGEVSYKRAIKAIEKNIDKLQKGTKQCPECGKEVLIGFKLCPHCSFEWKTTPPSHPSYTSHVEKPTSWWYLVPLLLGLIGGILGYIAVNDEDKEMAKTLLTIGIIMSFIDTLVVWMIYSYYVSMLSRLL